MVIFAPSKDNPYFFYYMAKNGISEDKIKYVIDVETSEIDYMYRCGNTE